ncbi:MAG: glycosyltransferase family 1 protein [Verrucomicrobiaceae bacterium]|nr:MAG: glycosyltransferase family 1 protein [Verrucomicrobiaceae bacterium]
MENKLQQAVSLVFPRKHVVIRREPAGKECGCVVISYITWPFVEGFDSPKMRGHTNAYEVIVMAEAFRDLGFRVEIIDWNNTAYVPPADCRIAIDIHGNLERWQGQLPPACKRILHATGPHWLFWNHAELARLQAVQARKGIALKPRRHVEPSRGVEVADEVAVLGNEFTRQSFLFGGKPVTRVPISSAYEFDWPSGRDFEKARRKFLWVGSYGMVHKGLDLALDAFAEMPDLELTVCGRPEKEEDFYRLYENLLLRTPNIRLHGWLDMATPDFLEIARTHAAVIYPSSAEGGAGSVIHCMHAGMLPVCTTEASIDLGDFGFRVESGTVQAVQEACRSVAGMPATDVEVRARGAYEHVRTAHTRERFRENYRKFAERVTEGIS